MKKKNRCLFLLSNETRRTFNPQIASRKIMGYYQGSWWVRWLSFAIVLIAFISLVVYAAHHQEKSGRIIGAKGTQPCGEINFKDGACITVSGDCSNYSITRGKGSCCAGANSVFSMQEDQCATPIIYQDGTGPLMCLTDSRIPSLDGLARVTLEPCVEGQANQLWTAKDNHIYSDSAVLCKDSKQCLSGSMTLLGTVVGSDHLHVAECKNREYQEWMFVSGVFACDGAITK